MIPITNTQPPQAIEASSALQTPSDSREESQEDLIPRVDRLRRISFTQTAVASIRRVVRIVEIPSEEIDSLVQEFGNVECDKNAIKKILQVDTDQPERLDLVRYTAASLKLILDAEERRKTKGPPLKGERIDPSQLIPDILSAFASANKELRKRFYEEMCEGLYTRAKSPEEKVATLKELAPSYHPFSFKEGSPPFPSFV